jgi:hypothetical protein
MSIKDRLTKFTKDGRKITGDELFKESEREKNLLSKTSEDKGNKSEDVKNKGEN